MQAIEFEATAHNHTISIPDNVPDGVPMRVLLLVNESVKITEPSENQWKTLLSSMPDVGTDEDFVRAKDYGRELSWDI
jgi:virulence-associated protein VagC